MGGLCIADEEILLRWGEFVPIQSLRLYGGYFQPGKTRFRALLSDAPTNQ